MHKGIFVLIFLVGCVLHAEECVLGPSCRFTVGTRQGKGIGYDEGYSSLDGFLTPNWTKPFQPFLDGRMHLFNNSRFAGNLGMGARLMALDNWAFGINGYYDARSEKALSPHQMGLGLEMLGYNVDFRFNAYFTVAETERRGPTRLIGFEGNTAIVSRRLSAAYSAMNAEVGFPIGGYFQPINLYIGLDPYYLFRKEVSGFNFGNTFGGLGRLNMRILDCVDIGGAFSYDRLFRGRINGYINISVPFSPSTLNYKGRRWRERYGYGGCSAAAAERRLLTQPVIRQEIIPMAHTKVSAVGQDPLTHQPLSLVFVSNAMVWPGAGTYDAPFKSLELAEKHSEPGQTIYIMPGDGTSRDLDTGIMLKDGQRLHGSSTNLLIDDTYYPASHDKAPSLINSKGVVVTLTDNNSIKGMNISGGIDATNAGNFHIYNSYFVDCGIDANGAPPGRKIIEENRFLRGGMDLADLVSSQVVIRANTMDDSHEAIVFGGPSTFKISENVLNQAEKGIIGELKSGRGYYFIHNNEIETTRTALGLSSFAGSGLMQVMVEENKIIGRDHFDDAILIVTGSKERPGCIEACIQKNNLQKGDAIVKVENAGSHLRLRLLDNWASGHMALINFARVDSFRVDSENLHYSGVSALNHNVDVFVPFEPVKFVEYDQGPRFFTPFEEVEE